MVRRFDYHNIEFKRDSSGSLLVKGEIVNNSGKNFHAVVFRIVIYMRSIPIGNSNVAIKGFYNGQTKVFEKQIEELHYDSVIAQRPTCQVFVESGY